MDAVLREAIALTKIQAGTRAMTGEEMQSMIRGIACGLLGATSTSVEQEQPVTTDWKKSIKARSIICLECGQSFKVLTKKHLAKHDLDPGEYRAVHDMPARTPLLCRELSKARREKMVGMKLWQRRGHQMP